jgi:hypothetical protein
MCHTCVTDDWAVCLKQRTSSTFSNRHLNLIKRKTFLCTVKPPSIVSDGTGGGQREEKIKCRKLVGVVTV